MFGGIIGTLLTAPAADYIISRFGDKSAAAILSLLSLGCVASLLGLSSEIYHEEGENLAKIASCLGGLGLFSTSVIPIGLDAAASIGDEATTGVPDARREDCEERGGDVGRLPAAEVEPPRGKNNKNKLH